MTNKPLTNAERQDRLRKRNLSEGRKELRGIYATEDERPMLRAFIKAWLKEIRSKG